MHHEDEEEDGGNNTPQNKRSSGSKARHGKKQWDRSHIRCLPFVEAEVRDRSGQKIKDRSVEEMIRLFRKRMSKSGVMEEYQGHRSFQKPSVRRRRKRLERDYHNRKQTERDHALRKLRGDSR